MGSPESVTTRQRCSLHADRPSVGACASCRRPVCLSCAIPFRGETLCVDCAARELGTPPPEPAPPRPSSRPEVAAGLLLVLGLVATIAPWHRSGTLTSAFSAWTPAPDPGAFVACLGLLGGAAVALTPVLLSLRPGRPAAIGYALLAIVAAVATTRTLAGAPDYFSPTFWPFAALGLSVAAATVGLLRLTRLP